ncbi:unnamed protein product [Amoebophrya sp. A120]|nr:unnamed protein product [Amoebophrya sp. A120]|eukprot:GSA120T00026310001.1
MGPLTFVIFSSLLADSLPRIMVQPGGRKIRSGPARHLHFHLLVFVHVVSLAPLPTFATKRTSKKRTSTHLLHFHDFVDFAFPEEWIAQNLELPAGDDNLHTLQENAPHMHEAFDYASMLEEEGGGPDEEKAQDTTMKMQLQFDFVVDDEKEKELQAPAEKNEPGPAFAEQGQDAMVNKKQDHDQQETVYHVPLRVDYDPEVDDEKKLEHEHDVLLANAIHQGCYTHVDVSPDVDDGEAQSKLHSCTSWVKERFDATWDDLVEEVVGGEKQKGKAEEVAKQHEDLGHDNTPALPLLVGPALDEAQLNGRVQSDFGTTAKSFGDKAKEEQRAIVEWQSQEINTNTNSTTARAGPPAAHSTPPLPFEDEDDALSEQEDKTGPESATTSKETTSSIKTEDTSATPESSGAFFQLRLRMVNDTSHDFDAGYFLDHQEKENSYQHENERQEFNFNDVRAWASTSTSSASTDSVSSFSSAGSVVAVASQNSFLSGMSNIGGTTRTTSATSETLAAPDRGLTAQHGSRNEAPPTTSKFIPVIVPVSSVYSVEISQAGSSEKEGKDEQPHDAGKDDSIAAGRAGQGGNTSNIRTRYPRMLKLSSQSQAFAGSAIQTRSA